MKHIWVAYSAVNNKTGIVSIDIVFRIFRVIIVAMEK